MSGESWAIHNDQSEKAFIKHVSDLRKKNGCVTYPAPRLGSTRSNPHNNLFHLWCRRYAKHLFNKSEISSDELGGMKLIIKKAFWLNYPWCRWMIKGNPINPITKESTIDYESSGKYKSTEMYMMLEFIQNYAAIDGLILESEGEFLKQQQEAEGV